MKVKVALEPQPEGGYVAYVPALLGCFSQGETKEEALENIKEAIELYREVLEEKELGKTMKKFVHSEGTRLFRCPYDKAPAGVFLGKMLLKPSESWVIILSARKVLTLFQSVQQEK